MTIAPVPAKTNAKVPMNSAQYFFIVFNCNLINSREQAWLFGRQKIGDSFLCDCDVHPYVGKVVKPYHIFRSHPDTAIACRPADRALLRRSVNVNTSIVRGPVLIFLAPQPNDA